ncbi:hypothetical protein, partial [Puia dinghuensis]|uniref:hypothetical protein n=1 Tax=Puia dinghuensis TaxID=1792502 RepID=UPI00166AE98D
MSLYAGLPQINIPIYTVEEGGIKVPISLDYHASGVRPDQHPGWVGLNWNLSAGGAITRIVKDIPDDDNEILGSQPLCQGRSVNGAGYYFNNTCILHGNWSSVSYIRDTICNQGITYKYDTEPDEFDFSFLGYSGKFFLDTAINTWQVQCDQRIKVTLIPDPSHPTQSLALSPPYSPGSCTLNNPWHTGYPSSFSGFILTTEDGTQYTFGGDTSHIEYSINFYAQGTDTWIANSWNLSRIQDAYGRVVTFTYTRGPLVSQITNSIEIRNKKVYPQNTTNYFWFIETFGLASANNFLTPSCSNSTSGIPPTGQFTGKLIAPLYLSQINSSYASVSFKTSITTELRIGLIAYTYFDSYKISQGSTIDDYYYFLYPVSGGNAFCNGGGGTGGNARFNNLQWLELDSIYVTNKRTNTLLNEYAFGYTHDTTKRLMLQSFQQLSMNQQTISPSPYRFYYDSSHTLPNYLTATGWTDHWGFYNGKDATHSLDTLSTYYNYRQADSNYLRAGTLVRVTYPTGGITDLAYEANMYSMELDTFRSSPLIDYGSTIKLAGGLRIKKITSYDVNYPNSPLIRQYYYFKNYSPSTGLTGASSGILGGKSQYYWDTYTTVSDIDPNQVYTEQIFSTQSVMPMSENTAGSHLGYSEVEEQYADGSLVDYQFTNFDNGHMDESFINNLQRTKSPYEPYASKAFERGKLVKKTTYNTSGQIVNVDSFGYFALNQNYVRAVKASVYTTCDNSNQFVCEGTSYKNYTYPFLMAGEYHTRYDVNGTNPVIDSTIYTYDTANYLQQTAITTNSIGQAITTSNKYPCDSLTGLSSSAQTAKGNLLAAGRLSPLLEQTVTKGSFQASRVRNDYTIWSNNTAMPQYVELQVGSNPVETRQAFIAYDAYQNLLLDSLSSDLTSGYLWDYSGLYPIAKITNTGPTHNFAYTSFEADGSGNWTISDTTR